MPLWQNGKKTFEKADWLDSNDVHTMEDSRHTLGLQPSAERKAQHLKDLEDGLTQLRTAKLELELTSPMSDYYTPHVTNTTPKTGMTPKTGTYASQSPLSDKTGDLTQLLRDLHEKQVVMARELALDSQANSVDFTAATGELLKEAQHSVVPNLAYEKVVANLETFYMSTLGQLSHDASGQPPAQAGQPNLGERKPEAIHVYANGAAPYGPAYGANAPQMFVPSAMQPQATGAPPGGFTMAAAQEQQGVQMQPSFMLPDAAYDAAEFQAAQQASFMSSAATSVHGDIDQQKLKKARARLDREYPVYNKPEKHVMRSSPPMTDDEIREEMKTFKVVHKRVKLDYLGILIFLLFILATGYYIYVRAAYSLAPLGPVLWYGIIIYILEIVGAITLIFYGVWLVARPNNNDVKEVLASKDGVKLRRRYHVRVLIPCYKESLFIVQRTVIAAHSAVVPEGCQVTVYLCDDGNDEKKAAFVASKNANNLVYITGRPKTEGRATNGKSENLNYALSLIYPDADSEEGKQTIPLTEVVCILDADQTCSRATFFPMLLAYLDSGDDVGASLSPQFVFNASHGDILNHQNIPFWEKMQPGMDALGFISLTGTNMILRARALHACGWFPTNTVTEDWALGMRLKAHHWKLRYCSQYLASGEAPEDLKQAIQQRSRWCKGHFQIFWSDACPMFNGGLSLFHKLTYSSTCLSYLSVGVTVPVMTLVPIVTLLFGYFPIALNFPTVLAITIYYIVLNMLTFYCSSLREYKALWLSNTATSIFWWPFLKAAFLTPIKSIMGRGLTFKATAKGSSAAATNLGLILPWAVLFLLSAIAFIAGLATISTNPSAPEIIALCWVVYNVVPHFLLMVYAFTGQSRVLDIICNLAIAVSAIVSIIALIALWIFYPRSADFQKAGTLSISYFQAQQSGPIQAGFPIPWRKDADLQYQAVSGYSLTYVGYTAPPPPPPAPARPPPANTTGNTTGPKPAAGRRLHFSAQLRHLADAAAGTNGTTNSTSAGPSAPVMPPPKENLALGFFTDGGIGSVKLPLHVAQATSMLAWSMLDFPSFWNEDPTRRQNAMDVLLNGFNFLDACYYPASNPDGTDPGWLQDTFVLQVGNISLEASNWRQPEASTDDAFVMAAIGSDYPLDLAAQFSAALVASALALKAYDAAGTWPYSQLMDKANRLYRGAMSAVATVDPTGTSGRKRSGLYTRIPSENRNATLGSAFTPRELIRDYYESNSFYDDLLWAATWFVRATQNNFLVDNANDFYNDVNSLLDAAYQNNGDSSAVSTDYWLPVAVVHGASLSKLVALQRDAQSFLYDWQCDSSVSHTHKGRACQSDSPLLGSTVLAAALAIAYTNAAAKNPKLGVDSTSSLMHSFECFAQAQGRYVLGVGLPVITPKSAMIGYSSNGASQTWSREASCPAAPDTCGVQYIPAQNGNDDLNQVDGALLWLTTCDDANSVREGRTEDTALSFDNNVGSVLLWAGLASSDKPWVQCLQGSGAFQVSGICKQGRPNPDRGPTASVAQPAVSPAS